jgi:fluoride exporter
MLASSFAVALGGAAGSLLRYWLAELFVRLGAVQFPWATLVANVSGSFAIGLIAAATLEQGRPLLPPELRLFLLVGVCGGYTTFSSFSLQTLTLAQGGEWGKAGLNVALSVVLCLLAVWLGYLAAAWLNRLQGA